MGLGRNLLSSERVWLSDLSYPCASKFFDTFRLISPGQTRELRLMSVMQLDEERENE
jgi:hypothetical protein